MSREAMAVDSRAAPSDSTRGATVCQIAPQRGYSRESKERRPPGGAHYPLLAVCG